jgi:hypothetical protein
MELARKKGRAECLLSGQPHRAIHRDELDGQPDLSFALVALAKFRDEVSQRWRRDRVSCTQSLCFHLSGHRPVGR